MQTNATQIIKSRSAHPLHAKGAMRAAKKVSKETQGGVRLTREIDDTWSTEVSAMFKCARSPEAVARMMKRLNNDAKALMAAAEKIPGAKRDLERALLEHGHVVAVVETWSARYKDGRTEAGNPRFLVKPF
jgi:hypothetical protein